MAETAGLMLLRAGLLTQEQFARVNQSRREHGGTLGGHLIALGLVTEEQLADFYRHRLMVPKIGRDALASVTKKVVAIVPPDMAAEFRVVPVSVDREGNLTLAMADPSDTHAVDEVGFFTGHFVMRAVTTESTIAWALDKYYSIPTKKIPVDAPPPPEPGEREVVLLTQPKPRAPAAPEVAAAAEPSVEPPAAAAEPVAAAPAEPPTAAPSEPPTEPAPTAGTVVVVVPLSEGDDTLAPVLLRRATAEPVAAPTDADAEVAAHAADEGVTLVQIELSTSGRVAAVTTPDAPAASPAAAALTQAIRSLREANEPDAVARALLGYFASFCGRTAFFTVRKARLRCEQAQGDDVTPAIRDYDASVDEPSIFREVIASRFPYRGAIGDSPAALALQEGLPPPGGADIVLVPIAVRHRVVSFAYGDRLNADPGEAGMTRVALEAGIAYERLIAARKEAGGKAAT